MWFVQMVIGLCHQHADMPQNKSCSVKQDFQSTGLNTWTVDSEVMVHRCSLTDIQHELSHILPS